MKGRRIRERGTGGYPDFVPLPEARGANNAVNVPGFVHPGGKARVSCRIDGSVSLVPYDYGAGAEAVRAGGAGNA